MDEKDAKKSFHVGFFLISPIVYERKNKYEATVYKVQQSEPNDTPRGLLFFFNLAPPDAEFWLIDIFDEILQSMKNCARQITLPSKWKSIRYVEI